MSDREHRSKTVADIVADIRERAYNATRHGERITDNYAVSELLKSIAANIEAAWKRERAKAEADALEVGGIVAARTAEKSSAVGNAAAMRDALVTILAEVERFYTNDWIPYYAWETCDGLVKRALSAPARNCDLNLSEKSLWDKFEDYIHDCGLPFYSEPSGEDAFGWLLAPAEERKGDGDATI